MEQLGKILEEAYRNLVKEYLGVSKPLTEAEKAEREAHWKEYRDSRHQLHKDLLGRCDTVNATLRVTLRAILELHRPSSGQYFIHCQGCDYSGYDSEPPEYPCRTVELIKERLLPNETV